MIRAFYTAASGSKSNQTYLDVISNNMANLQTNGYKTVKAEFSELLYSNLNQVPGQPNLMVGSGSKIGKTNTLFTQGPIMQTENQNDFAIEGDGFFGIMKNDEIYYTRTGNFTIGCIDDEKYLMLDSGFVLDNNEDPIIIDDETSDMNIGVYLFENNGDLERVGESLFKLSNEDAYYEMAERANIKRGYIEGSGVSLSEEMVKMIQTQRAFQFNSKIIQVADEIEQTINSLRG
ncbi:flagellar hook-basal body protein [Sedimentibacter sp. zth1]|uniref:flagellar hook-basal body protein n=1 Tax=Sedimentibacter sp. zth1 TaxID=2816908 RepID=UPI001A919EFB|nr:flagellar hook-basal body protein [Sedimentibacter sp. zth1]QSX07181.1 flagellar hook-basal body protein [Sedimentibacter sp. zth1]